MDNQKQLIDAQIQFLDTLDCVINKIITAIERIEKSEAEIVKVYKNIKLMQERLDQIYHNTIKTWNVEDDSY